MHGRFRASDDTPNQLCRRPPRLPARRALPTRARDDDAARAFLRALRPVDARRRCGGEDSGRARRERWPRAHPHRHGLRVRGGGCVRGRGPTARGFPREASPPSARARAPSARTARAPSSIASRARRKRRSPRLPLRRPVAPARAPLLPASSDDNSAPASSGSIEISIKHPVHLFTTENAPPWIRPSSGSSSPPPRRTPPSRRTSARAGACWTTSTTPSCCSRLRTWRSTSTRRATSTSSRTPSRTGSRASTRCTTPTASRTPRCRSR